MAKSQGMWRDGYYYYFGRQNGKTEVKGLTQNSNGWQAWVPILMFGEEYFASINHGSGSVRSFVCHLIEHLLCARHSAARAGNVMVRGGACSWAVVGKLK